MWGSVKFSSKAAAGGRWSVDTVFVSVLFQGRVQGAPGWRRAMCPQSVRVKFSDVVGRIVMVCEVEGMVRFRLGSV